MSDPLTAGKWLVADDERHARDHEEADVAALVNRGVDAGSDALDLSADDNGKLITNEGDTGAASTRPKNLPAAAAGLCFRFYDQDGNGIRIQAAAGDTIRIGALESAVAGYVESTAQGQMLVLHAINDTEWVAENVGVDIWNVV